MDDFVGSGEQHWRDGDAERCGGLQVNHQIKFLRPLDRQVARFGTVQNPTDTILDEARLIEAA